MWKDIKNYEGYYQVNERGQVKRLASFRKNGTTGYVQPEKVLKNTSRGNTNYLCVHLSKEGKSKVVNVHRLVAESFILNPDNKPQVNHIDGDRTNNNVRNLEWATVKENINHCDIFLGRKRNKEGLKLGSVASTKNNLNIFHEGKIFQTYKEIMAYLVERLGHDISLKQVQQNIRSCCKGERKTAFGLSWEYIK